MERWNNSSFFFITISIVELMKNAILRFILPIGFVFGVLAGCGKEPVKPYVYTQLGMGTVIEISLWEKNGVEKEIFDEIERIEKKFSVFIEDSDVAIVNNAGGRSVEIDSELSDIIEKSLEFRELTNGAFDITKSGAEIKLNKNDKTISIQIDKDARLDFGGIVKGYAVGRAMEICKRSGLDKAIVNIGGNLYFIGYPANKGYWTVGIKDPDSPKKLIGSLQVQTNLSVATSGNYERPGHIIDPETNEKAGKCLSVTIVSGDCVAADALSTGVFVLGPEKGMELIERLDNVEAVIVTEDGVIVSSGLKDKYNLNYESMY